MHVACQQAAWRPVLKSAHTLLGVAVVVMPKITRSINLILGVWLAVSGHLWTHSDAQLGNAWVVGLAVAVVAAFDLRRLSWVNGVVAIWLFVSAFALPHASTATVWNSVIVSVMMFSVAVAETIRPPSSGQPLR